MSYSWREKKAVLENKHIKRNPDWKTISNQCKCEKENISDKKRNIKVTVVPSIIGALRTVVENLSEITRNPREVEY